MIKLIRFVNQGIHGLFISDGKYLGDGIYQFENGLPDGQSMAVLIDLPEEFTDSLIVHESLHGREDVVQECYKRHVCTTIIEKFIEHIFTTAKLTPNSES